MAHTPDDHSRYGTNIATVLKPVKAVELSEVPGIIAGLRTAFGSDRTLSREWRIQQLKAVIRMINECKKDLCEAMLKDLHKSAFEGYVTELELVLSEAQVAIAHLDEWMTPKKTSNSALNIPCWSTTQHDPLGLVFVMGAWNYPVQLALAPLVGAIAGGNCVVIKPGSYSVAVSNCLARIIPKYMDSKCIRVIEGNRHMTTALLKERFDKIFFTGSGFVGRIVALAAAEHLTPCVLELGGKSPFIIDRSANLVHASERLVWGSFLNGGQTCVRPDFVMVHKDVADAFFKHVQTTLIKFYGENPQHTEWFGRCINDSAFKRLIKLMNDNMDLVVVGGDRDASDKYIQPTVYDFGTDLKAFESNPLMQDELFGPLLPCVRYSETEEAVQFVRRLATGKPLALYAFSSDSKFIDTIKTRTTSGGLVINDCLMHLANHALPFGGVGSSGMGSYHGHYSFQCFTHEKAVLQKSSFLDESFLFKPLLAVRFPPYTPFKKFMVKTFSHPVVEKIVNFPIPFVRSLLKLMAVCLVCYALGFRVVRV